MVWHQCIIEKSDMDPLLASWPENVWRRVIHRVKVREQLCRIKTPYWRVRWPYNGLKIKVVACITWVTVTTGERASVLVSLVSSSPSKFSGSVSITEGMREKNDRHVGISCQQLTGNWIQESTCRGWMCACKFKILFQSFPVGWLKLHVNRKYFNCVWRISVHTSR
jgi:hypothetical protein